MKEAERMIEASGVELCTESFGRPDGTPILLIMGTGATAACASVRECHMKVSAVRLATVAFPA